MTTTVETDHPPIDVSEELTRAREVVDEARSDGHTALVAHTRLLTIETLTQQITTTEAEIRTARDEWSDWVRTAVDTSQEVADEQDWCGVFDAAMERLGLPARRPPDVDIGWRCTVTLQRTVDDDDITRMVRNDLGYIEGIEVSQSAVVEVEVRVEGERTAESGSCICDQIDTDDIECNLPSWASDGEWDITDEGTVYCDND
jgi:hypothetical protein